MCSVPPWVGGGPPCLAGEMSVDGCPPSRHQGGVGRADYVLPNPTGLSEGGVRAGNRPRGFVPGAQGRAGGADRASFFVDLYFAGSVSSVVTGRRSCLGRRPRSCVGVRARAAPLASYVDLDCGCGEFVCSGVRGGGLVCVLLLRALPEAYASDEEMRVSIKRQMAAREERVCEL